MGAALFYDQFLKVCEENGVKPTPALKEIGLSPGNLKKWESGSSIGSDILAKIANYFDVSTDYLLGQTNLKTKNPSLKGICDKIGLSDKSVLMLSRLKKENNPRLCIINLLLEQADDDIEDDYEFDGIYEGSVLNAVCRYLDGSADNLLSMEFDDYNTDRIRYTRIRSAVRKLIFDQAVEAIKAFDEPKKCHE